MSRYANKININTWQTIDLPDSESNVLTNNEIKWLILKDWYNAEPFVNHKYLLNGLRTCLLQMTKTHLFNQSNDLLLFRVKIFLTIERWIYCTIPINNSVYVRLRFKVFLGRSWSHCSWIYNYMYLCNQCLSPLMLWVRIHLGERCTTLCDKVCQWLATGRYFSPHTPVSSTNKTDRHDITEILKNMVLNTKKLNQSKSFL